MGPGGQGLSCVWRHHHDMGMGQSRVRPCGKEAPPRHVHHLSASLCTAPCACHSVLPPVLPQVAKVVTVELLENSEKLYKLQV